MDPSDDDDRSPSQGKRGGEGWFRDFSPDGEFDEYCVDADEAAAVLARAEAAAAAIGARATPGASPAGEMRTAEEAESPEADLAALGGAVAAAARDFAQRRAADHFYRGERAPGRRLDFGSAPAQPGRGAEEEGEEEEEAGGARMGGTSADASQIRGEAPPARLGVEIDKYATLAKVTGGLVLVCAGHVGAMHAFQNGVLGGAAVAGVDAAAAAAAFVMAEGLGAAVWRVAEVFGGRGAGFARDAGRFMTDLQKSNVGAVALAAAINAFASSVGGAVLLAAVAPDTRGYALAVELLGVAAQAFIAQACAVVWHGILYRLAKGALETLYEVAEAVGAGLKARATSMLGVTPLHSFDAVVARIDENIGKAVVSESLSWLAHILALFQAVLPVRVRLFSPANMLAQMFKAVLWLGLRSLGQPAAAGDAGAGETVFGSAYRTLVVPLFAAGLGAGVPVSAAYAGWLGALAGPLAVAASTDPITTAVLYALDATGAGSVFGALGSVTGAALVGLALVLSAFPPLGLAATKMSAGVRAVLYALGFGGAGGLAYVRPSYASTELARLPGSGAALGEAQRALTTARDMLVAAGGAAGMVGAVGAAAVDAARRLGAASAPAIAGVDTPEDAIAQMGAGVPLYIDWEDDAVKAAARGHFFNFAAGGGEHIDAEMRRVYGAMQENLSEVEGRIKTSVDTREAHEEASGLYDAITTGDTDSGRRKKALSLVEKTQRADQTALEGVYNASAPLVWAVRDTVVAAEVAGYVRTREGTAKDPEEMLARLAGRSGVPRGAGALLQQYTRALADEALIPRGMDVAAFAEGAAFADLYGLGAKSVPGAEKFAYAVAELREWAAGKGTSEQTLAARRIVRALATINPAYAAIAPRDYTAQFTFFDFVTYAGTATVLGWGSVWAGEATTAVSAVYAFYNRHFATRGSGAGRQRREEGGQAAAAAGAQAGAQAAAMVMAAMMAQGAAPAGAP